MYLLITITYSYNTRIYIKYNIPAIHILVLIDNSIKILGQNSISLLSLMSQTLSLVTKVKQRYIYTTDS
jgi:hypothetical protein